VTINLNHGAVTDSRRLRPTPFLHHDRHGKLTNSTTNDLTNTLTTSTTTTAPRSRFFVRCPFRPLTAPLPTEIRTSVLERDSETESPADAPAGTFLICEQIPTTPRRLAETTSANIPGPKPSDDEQKNDSDGRRCSVIFRVCADVSVNTAPPPKPSLLGVRCAREESNTLGV
jgi:hypothetical protein